MSARKRDRSKHARRDRKYKKKRSGMRVDGRSIFTIVDIIIKKAKEIKDENL